MYTTLGKCLPMLKRLLCSCQVMISLIMTKSIVPTQELDVHIKIFLSDCHRFCTEYYDSSVTEFWFTKGNFISLLNLPEQIEQHGKAGYYWGGIFERFIPMPKGYLIGARKNPQLLQKRMILMQRETSINYIRTNLRTNAVIENDEDGVGSYIGVRIYSKREQIIERLSTGKCLSCFRLNGEEADGCVFAPYSTGRSTVSKWLRDENG